MATPTAQPLALVTGSCGLIGSEVSVYFNQAGFRIAGIDSNARADFLGSEGDTNWVLNRLKSAIPGSLHHAAESWTARLGLGTSLGTSLQTPVAT
jgi:nucleoside-diphosphate-sugar epimerase